MSDDSAGRPNPGANWDGTATQFAVWAPQATGVDLCLFDAGDHSRQVARLPMSERDGVWSITQVAAPPGTPYGFRANGPYRPKDGLRFNPAKLLVDPYARSVRGCVTWAPALFGYPPGNADSDSPDPSDSGPLVPRSVVVDGTFDWQGVARPGTALEETIIYEAHVKGLTMLHPGVPANLRGTYAGAAHPDVLAHFKELGITAVEFLPVHTHVDDGFLVARGLTNYWGYSTLGFFSPDASYAASREPGGEVREFKEMVRAYHRAGLEVLLDVVYNHTAESNHQGPTLSFRGLHNPEFYWLSARDRSRYLDLTGTGNTIKVYDQYVTDFVIESLRYWVTDMGVDGFRFDLAPVIGRTMSDFDRHAPIFDRIREDDVLSTIKLIAEPWDIGPSGYQVGSFPDNWSEWNDRFRDVIRSFWRSDDNKMREMGFRLTGSADFYGSRKLGPLASINFVAAHDGMTTSDLIAYQAKRNYSNGDNNSDGTGNDVNQYIGPDGPTSEPEIDAARQLRARNLLGTLMVARGVPMLLGGDEFGRSQSGNNNAYCQDNPTSWIDWNLREQNEELLEYVKSMIALRKSDIGLRINRFPDDSIEEPDPWVWFVESGKIMTGAEWGDPERRVFGVYLEAQEDASSERLLLLFNASGEDAMFTLPSALRVTPGTVEPVISSATGNHAPLCAPASSLSIVQFRAG